jgi:hypothetical protein
VTQVGVVWFVVPESATQSFMVVGGANAVELRQPSRDCESHSTNHDVEGIDRCTKKPYWGATKKACDVDQYGAPPMDGSKEDDQTGCTRKLYWGAAKKSCGVDQYRALLMDGSKDGQAGAPATAVVA